MHISASAIREGSTDSLVNDVTAIDLAGIFITIGVGTAVWLLASFVISRITKRVASGTSLFKKPHFRWVAPALRALDNERRAQRAHTIGSLLKSVATVAVVTISIIYILKYLNVDITPLLTSVGILGVAIGFGAQQLIRDFLAGIFITIEDQYGIGDIIETSEVVGTVESVGLRITRVRAEDGAIWYLRNGEILRVGNRSQGNYVPPEEASTKEGDAGDSTAVVEPASAARVPAAPKTTEHPDQKAGE